MSDANVTLKTMADLEKEKVKFFIDAYQRGYRWTKKEVKDLLDDIREFSKQMFKEGADKSKFYCLQPVIVTYVDDSNTWKVIDGQQRLTALYLIYSYYHAKDLKIKRYGLCYHNKPLLEECLEAFGEKKYKDSKTVAQEMSKYERDIDCHYVVETYKCICDYFNRLPDDGDIWLMKSVFDKQMKIIWYEIPNCDKEKEVDVFSKINVGKIPLTNAELIKALLLKVDKSDSLSEAKRANIAIKWDEIEAQLTEEDFWSFLVNDKKGGSVYATRIDFIFHVMAKDLNEGILLKANEKYPEDEPYAVLEEEPDAVLEEANREKFSFYVFSNYVRLLREHKEFNPYKDSKDSDDKEYIWKDVCEYYRMFKDWYKNLHWYHMIGFLIGSENGDYIGKIVNLGRLYRQSDGGCGEGHKDRFEEALRARIRAEVFGKDKDSYSTADCKEFIDGLYYDNGKKIQKSIRKILLLYNIAYLDLCDNNCRFPFGKYKKESWDIEHINAVADTMPDDDRNDTGNNSRLRWIESAEGIPQLNEIETSDGQKVKDLIETVKKGKLYLEKNQRGTGDFTKLYESIIRYFEENEKENTENSIGNLTLLDSGTNRSYKNDVFPLKRDKIFDQMMKDVFIPLCTRRVFMKAYKESTDLLRWEIGDQRAYLKDINLWISKYLKLDGAEGVQNGK